MLSQALITTAAAIIGAAVLVGRARKARPARAVLVATTDGRVIELPENDPRIAPHL